jgi:hypothetical protein
VFFTFLSTLIRAFFLWSIIPTFRRANFWVGINTGAIKCGIWSSPWRQILEKCATFNNLFLRREMVKTILEAASSLLI